MALEYHQSTFNFLNVEPVVSKERLTTLADREKKLELSLPSSIREWYSIEGVEKLFHENTNQDELISIESLGDFSETQQGYLRVGIENQGVVAWYAKLDSSSDPQVFDNNDQWPEDLSEIDWRPFASSFTTFIFDMTSSFYFRSWQSGARLIANDEWPNAVDIDKLRGTYQAGPVTDCVGSRVLRFFNRNGILRISAQSEEMLNAGKAEWNIECDSLDSLHEFAHSVWRIGNLPNTLVAESCTKESRLDGEKVINKLRKNFAPR